MIEPIQIDNSVISFTVPKFHFGQKVQVNRRPGYILGAQREKYCWSYLIVEGDPPNNDSDEHWHVETDISPME
ncbi:hypothetical protein ACKFKG_23775 [Phormidesmis sp. 146-35]